MIARLDDTGRTSGSAFAYHITCGLLADALRAAAPPLLFGLPVGFGMLGILCRVLARARQSILGRHVRSNRLSAASRRVAAQGLVSHDRHVDRRRRDLGADRVLSAGSRAVSPRAALWGAACALVSTLLRNFAAYAAALAGYAAVIIALDQLGATGGPNGQAFMLAVYRASKIALASSAPASCSPERIWAAHAAGWGHCSPALSARSPAISPAHQRAGCQQPFAVISFYQLVLAWGNAGPLRLADTSQLARQPAKSGAQRSARIAVSSAPTCPLWLASTDWISER